MFRATPSAALPRRPVTSAVWNDSWELVGCFQRVVNARQRRGGRDSRAKYYTDTYSVHAPTTRRLREQVCVRSNPPPLANHDLAPRGALQPQAAADAGRSQAILLASL